MDTAKVLARQQLFRYFFFGVFAVLLWQLARVFSVFFTGFLWAAILTLMFYPLHAWLLRTRRVSENMAALLSTLSVLFVFILPIGFFGWLLVKEAATVYPEVRDWVLEVRAIRSAPAESALPLMLQPYWERAQGVLEPLGVDIEEISLKYLDQITAKIAQAGTHAAGHLPLWIFNLLVLVLSLFFLFKDGAAFIRWAVDLIPMEPAHKQHILEQVNATFGAVVRGFLAVALIQGFLAGLGFWAAGVRFPLLLGLLCVFAAFIPVGGTALVWGPIAAYMIWKGIPHGFPLLLWCMVMVGGLDNVLKAWLIGTRIRVPVLILFLALLGGLHTYGFLGVLLGPLLVTSALAFVRIYRQEYHLKLPTEQQRT